MEKLSLEAMAAFALVEQRFRLDDQGYALEALYWMSHDRHEWKGLSDADRLGVIREILAVHDHLAG